MKKSLLLFASMLTLGVAATPVFAQSDENADRIAEIESQIKELKAELKELKGDSEETVIIADDDDFYIEFKEIKEKDDSYTGKSYEIIFEVENKSDMSVEVQARSLSIDGMMVDNAVIIMSQEVAPGKKAKAVLELIDYSGEEEVPELVGDLEMDLHFFSWDDFDYGVDYPVVINLD